MCELGQHKPAGYAFCVVSLFSQNTMIPRLPPLLLALIGGASIYGIKAVLDRLDPPAIGPPGSSERAARMLKYRDYARRGGIVAVAAGFAWAGYWSKSRDRLETNDKYTYLYHP